MSATVPGTFPGTFRTATLLALVMLAGCKTKPADPPAARPTAPPRSAPAAAPTLPESPAPADPAAQARGVAAIQHLANTLAVDAKDCDKVAVDLRAFIADNRPLLAQLMASASQPADPEVADRAAASAAARSLQTAMAGCVASPAVAAAIKDLPGP
jgi:hypothetical protein